MRVWKLMQLLADCDPEAFVTVSVRDASGETAGRLGDTPASRLWFRVLPRADHVYPRFPRNPPEDEVVIAAALDGSGLAADDEAGAAFPVVPPDAREVP